MDKLTDIEFQEKVKAIKLRKQWFFDRIGKTIYRNETTCDCNTCDNVYQNGLFVSDKMQAEYAFDCECVYDYEGIPLKYFDTVEERDEFEKGFKKEALK